MQRDMVEKFKTENRPVWFMEEWSGLPTKAEVIKVCNDGNTGEYAKVRCIHDDESNSVGTKGVLLKKLYPSKEALLALVDKAEQKRIAEIKASVQTMEDCIKFMFNTPVACAEEYTDYVARRAVQELVMERWGLELK